MLAKTYYLDEAKTEAINLRWGLFWKNFTISQDGGVLARLTSRSALKQGVAVTLADGRVLEARLQQQFAQEEVELLLDGQPLPGSSTHPYYRLQQAFYALLFIGGLNLLLGLVAELGLVAVLQQYGFGYATAVVGLVYFGLAWWARAKKARLPLYLGMALLVLDVVVAFVDGGPGSPPPPTAGLFLRFFLVMLLYKGGAAARQLRAEAAASAVA
ncbi:hypothetical protein GCM10022408_20430 [Hymenobacter fastidiosus]|uniref:Uncharacterized protein n=1 Tax=Hymenobacter fastidiosus TaxID=486264 RepID=A0ABP7S888_9BACT